tara:strand:- start:86 stop:514 length:429 start_codon:yes stop_codon:yes gene_type:complete
LTALLKDAIDYLEMNKSFRHEGDYIEAVSYLIDTFPAMKLEEWKLICQRLKAGYYGTMYERLKLPELVSIFQRHEGERAEYMETQMQNDRKARESNVNNTPQTEIQKELWKAFIKKLDLAEADTDKSGRWKFIEHPNKTGEE